MQNHLNPFVHNALFLYPLKTSENLSVFWYFQGVEKGCIGKELVNIQSIYQFSLNETRKWVTEVKGKVKMKEVNLVEGGFYTAVVYSRTRIKIPLHSLYYWMFLWSCN